MPTPNPSHLIADQSATQRQLRYLQAVAREAGYDGAALDERSVQEFGIKAAALSRRDASTLIDRIQCDKRTWDGQGLPHLWRNPECSGT